MALLTAVYTEERWLQTEEDKEEEERCVETTSGVVRLRTRLPVSRSSAIGIYHHRQSDTGGNEADVDRQLELFMEPGLSGS